MITIMHFTTGKIEVTAVQRHNMFLHAHYSQPHRSETDVIQAAL